jgi:hypothetical protein
MRHWRIVIWGIGMFLAGAVVTHTHQANAQPQQPTGPNYLYIEEFDFAPGSVANDGIAELTQWVRDMRASGEYTSVRLYEHNTGPHWALYIMAEPKSWQAIETGFEKFFGAHPEIMTTPLKNWGGHSETRRARAFTRGHPQRQSAQ